MIKEKERNVLLIAIAIATVINNEICNCKYVYKNILIFLV